MTYKLRPQNGDSVAVPQLIFSCLNRTDEDCIRVALYILATGSLEARDIAHALRLKSVKAAEDALRWWAGAGLLTVDTGVAAAPPVTAEPLRPEEINLSALRDPMVSTLIEETQAYTGKILSPREISRLVALYLNEDFPVEVMLLCAARLSLRGKKSIAQLEHELRAWRQAGVETGEQAEKYMQLLDARQQRENDVAQWFGLMPDDLTLADRRSIRRWFEELHLREDLIQEAILQAQDKKSVRYVNGILKAWHSRGLTTVQQVRGGGTLDTADSASLRVDRQEHSGNDILKRRPTGLRLKRED